MRAWMTTAIVGAALAASATAGAQTLELRKPAARQGYYIGGGLRSFSGGGHADHVGALGLMFGFGGVFRFGQMTNDWLGLGLTLGGGGSSNKEWVLGGGNLSLEVQIKPLTDYDLAVRGSIGLGAFGLARVDPDRAREDDPTGGLGAQYTIGASYDLFPFYEKDQFKSGGFAFSGFAELSFLPTSEIWSLNFIVGLETTYWFGLGKNKLELPPEEAFKLKK